jgi:hypothetical protein
MDEVKEFERLYPAHRFISDNDLKIDGGDVVISSQQICMLASWMNDPEYS